jgi:hypothetical protein
MRSRSLKADLELPAEEVTEPASSTSFHAKWWSNVRKASRLGAKARADWMRQVRNYCGGTRALDSEKRWRLLNVAELKQLADAGMTIGAHALTHPVLSLSSEEEARCEIQESKIQLERSLGTPVWAFAYPFGNPSTIGSREVRLARQAGFACAFLNVERWGTQHSNLFAHPRTHVSSDTTLAEFAAHLSGLHARLQEAVGS